MSDNIDYVSNLKTLRTQGKLTEAEYTTQLEALVRGKVNKEGKDETAATMQLIHDENIYPHLRTIRSITALWESVWPVKLTPYKANAFSDTQKESLEAFTMKAKRHVLHVAEVVYGSYVHLGFESARAIAYLNYMMLQVRPEDKIKHHNVLMLMFYPKVEQDHMAAAVLKLQYPLFPPVNNELKTLNSDMLTEAADSTMRGGGVESSEFFSERSWTNPTQNKKPTVRGGAYNERIVNEQGETVLALQMDGTDQLLRQLVSGQLQLQQQINNLAKKNAQNKPSGQRIPNQNYGSYRSNQATRGRGRGNYQGRGYQEEDEEADENVPLAIMPKN